MKPFVWRSLITCALCLVAGLFMTACGGGGGSDSGAGTGTGTLSTSLTDSSTDEYRAVYVTIARIDVHHQSDGTWETVASPNKTYNLLELVNGVRETLGVATLGAGHYTQMRLIIGDTADNGLNILSKPHRYANYIIERDIVDTNYNGTPLKVPSGMNTGLKIVNGFDININQTTELILDFDAMRSVVLASSGGQYLLKPTVKVLKVAECAIVDGTVTDIPPATTPPSTPMVLAGALVNAQIVDNLAADQKDQVVIEAGTVADGNGEFALFLAPGGYNLVVSKDGYLPACAAITLAKNDKPTVDFSLAATDDPLGSIAGTVAIAGAAVDQYVTIDFRQASECGSGATTITVKSVNVANGNSYTVDLPAGSYQVVASTYGKTTQEQTVNVLTGEVTPPVDITFP